MESISRSLTAWIALVLLVTAASGSVLSIGSSEVTAIGNTTTVTMILDEAPDGLSGYSINVSVGNPDVAAITSVSYPSWASLSDTSALPSTDCLVKATDLSEKVQPGATEITLATVTLRGSAPGTTTVNLVINMMNADSDEILDPAISPGTCSVTVSGGSIDATAPEESSPGSSPVSSGVATVATTHQATSAATAAATLPPEETKVRTMAAEPAATETAAAAAPKPVSSGSLDLSLPLLIPGFAVVIVAALVVLYLAVTRRL